MPAALNLSNEVVKMRAEVKKVKVFVIRKLTRTIEVLKKKKGNEAVLEKHKRRVARLHEEIRELRTLAPDVITKTALQKDINFKNVCQNNNASLSERAIARIASHPDFSNKILKLKKAIEAFEAERKSNAKTDKKTKKETKDIEQQSDAEPVAEDMEEAGQTEDTANQDEDSPISVTEKSLETDSAPAEVMRMRKAVKKLRMLIIRKLSQDISSLKKMKGEESDLKEYRDSAAKLQSEVQVLRDLVPDHVTTRALQGNINMEEVLQDPESSPLDKATARIATHPRFIEKLQAVRELIEQEKMKAALIEEENMVREVTVAEYGDSDDEGDESDLESDDDDDEEGEEEEEEEEEEDNEEEEDEGEDEDDIKGDDEKTKTIKQPVNVIKGSNVVKPLVEAKAATVASVLKPKESATDKAVKTAVVTHSVPAKSKNPATPAGQSIQPEAKKTENKKEEESDLELSDGEQEKEYFDDSTEERFHKQSSLSEESDEDDFFLGKVSKLKKKKSASSGAEKKSEPKTSEVQTAKESNDKAREFKMQSVFCSALSESGGSSQKGQHRGSKPPHFQNQKKRPDGDVKPSWFKSQGSGADRRPSAAVSKGPGPRQMGAGGTRMGKPEFERQQNQTNRAAHGKPFRPPQHSQQAMHPSWEASRKRKEQQSQITAFQGKKIKFDDDDD